jgi:hypothetical protein
VDAGYGVVVMVAGRQVPQWGSGVVVVVMGRLDKGKKKTRLVFSCFCNECTKEKKKKDSHLRCGPGGGGGCRGRCMGERGGCGRGASGAFIR